MLMASILGIDGKILCAWQSFLAQMTRAFVIQQAIGHDHHSTNGFPEGDSLSCIALLVMSFSLHLYMTAYAPAPTQTWSYVDNLQVLGNSTGSVQQAFLVMQTWAQLFGLRLDVAKTVYWASSAQARQVLKSAGNAVVEGSKDLGAAMIYGTRLLNAPLRARILAIEPFWKKLRLMKVANWYKHLAIRMALLPRALFGASSARLGRCWIRRLRTGAMKALKCNRPGASPILRLSCITPTLTDPGFYEASLTLREFQSNLQMSADMRERWHDYVLRSFGRRTHGPFAKMEDICHELHWHIDEAAMLHLPDGFSMSLLRSTQDAVEQVLMYSWHQHVAESLLHRQDYAGLQGMDHHASFRGLHKLNLADYELLNCIRDGTFHLRSFKAKFDASVDALCPYCDLADTLRHRALTCPFYEDARQQFPDCVTFWDSHATALTHHGLCSANPWQWKYWAALEDISSEPCWHVYPDAAPVQHLFTDGSCSQPTRPELALSAWAVVSANHGRPIASGILPGHHQSINRAELWAIIMALRWACENGVMVEIWTDSKYAFDGFQELLEIRELPQDWLNLDLWQLGMEWLCRLAYPPIFHKVKAHRDPATERTEREAWMARYNGVADASAKATVLYPGHSHLHEIRSQLLAVDQRNHHLAERYQLFLLALAKQGLASQTEPLDAAMDESGELGLDLTLHGEVNTGDFRELFPVDIHAALDKMPILHSMGMKHAHQLVEWLGGLSDEAEYDIEVTTLELCIGFMADGHSLPCQINFGHGPQWVDPADFAVGELLGHTLAAKHSAFLALFKATSRAFGTEWICGSSARISCGVHRRFSVASIPWPMRLAQRVQSLLVSFTCTRPIRCSADMARTLQL